MKIYNLLNILVLLASCANPVSPTGGPKDITPPVIIHTQIDTNLDAYVYTFYFDENIKTKNDILFNPQRLTEKKPTIEAEKRKVTFSIPLYVRNFSLNSSISDLNENNTGKYPPNYFNKDTTFQKIPYSLPQYFQKEKSYFKAEIQIDTLIYRSYNNKDTLLLQGFPSDKPIIFFIDQNKNEKYDSTEWFSPNHIDTSFILYPPLLNKIELDTSEAQIIGVFPFYLTSNSFYSEIISHQQGDTLIFKPGITTKQIIHNNKVIYKTYKKPTYITQIKHIIDKDTHITYYKSIGAILNYNNPSTKMDTIKTTKHFNSIEFHNTEQLNKINVLVIEDGQIVRSLTIDSTENLILPEGKYNYIAFIDKNNNNQLDYSSNHDSVIAYFEPLVVNRKFKNVINIGKAVKNDSINSGKHNGESLLSIPPKKGVKQTISIPN